MTSTPAPIPTLQGLAEVADRYDLILCDVWGVLHDGQTAHGAAGEALIRFRDLPGARPRRVVLVSNAPRPGDGVGRILDRFGVPREAYDAILTSGDLTHDLIAARPGARIRHLGPERDLGIFQGLDLSLVPETEADLVVCTGLFDDRSETPDDYRPELERLAARGLTMICANPDLVVESGNRLIPCAGLLAAAYAEIGGPVVYAGKPHRPVYEAALAKGRRSPGPRWIRHGSWRSATRSAPTSPAPAASASRACWWPAASTRRNSASRPRITGWATWRNGSAGRRCIRTG